MTQDTENQTVGPDDVGAIETVLEPITTIQLVLVEDGKVMQKETVLSNQTSYIEELMVRGFKEAPEGTVCGDLHEDGEFKPAPPAPKSWDNVRAQRDALLRQSDFTQLPDAPLNTTEKNAWREYRQALRDITDAGDPDSVIWPERPQ